MPASLHAELFSGPIDVIGDVHGEIGALISLIDRLGYDHAGRHPEGRRLIFVGDLVDRGPDSPRVVALVADWIRRGRAQCVIGNHELNHLRGERKHGGRWAWGEVEVMSLGPGEAAPRATYQAVIDAGERARMVEFFATLPVALERSDVRVIHACWHPPALAEIARRSGGLAAIYEECLAEADAAAGALPADTPDRAIAETLTRQNANPMCVLTSGLEHGPVRPYFAGGKVRQVARLPWWRRYDDEPLVLFGHYWRRLPGERRPADAPDLFPNARPWQWLGSRQTAMCVDYSVGMRFRERLAGRPAGGGGCALAALRISPDPRRRGPRGLSAELLFETGERYLDWK